jgi:5-methylcytosine-specific restriction endonuclease McrA
MHATGKLCSMRTRSFECVDCGLSSRTYRCGVCTLRAMQRRDLLDHADMVDHFRSQCMCVYCGEPATDREHVIPRSLGGFWTVPACKDCNALAGASLQPSLADRRRHIAAKLRRKYAKVLRMPEWDREELDELGAGLRTAVADLAAAREIVWARLEFMRLAER